MPSDYINNLIIRRDTVAAELAALTRTSGTPGSLPNLKYTDGGPTVDHSRYKMDLYKELREINQQILDAQAVEASMADDEDGPFEHATVMET